MDIGNKLQRARTKANLTQEQVAETLGVSRQTISNWENEKTYPDIKSVVTLSDLYQVSLDYLLKDKEDTSMSNYLDYLEESTNTVRSKNKLSFSILMVAYLVIWAAAMIEFWFLMDGSDAMGFSLMFLWILIPGATFVISLLIGRNNYLGKYNWFCCLYFGAMYMLADYGTFKVANMITFNNINYPEFELLLFGALISVCGLLLGRFCRPKEKAEK